MPHRETVASPPAVLPDFAQGSILSAILRQGLPTMIGFLALHLYDLADMFWVSRLGAANVAAIALFEGFYWVLISSNDVAGFGSIAVISRRYGEGDLLRAEAAIKETFILKWCCAVPSAILGLIFLPQLMTLMGAKDEVAALGVQYGTIRLYGLGFFFAGVSVFTSLRCIEAPKIAMYIMLGGAVLNAALDPLLIFGIGPFPELGIRGAALATVIGYIFTFGIGLFLYFNKRTPVHLHWRSAIPVQTRNMFAMMKIGLPGGINTVSFTLSQSVVTPLVAVFGTAVVAAYGVGSRVMSIGILLAFGLGISISPLIGNLLGAGLIERVWKTTRQSLLLIFGVLTICSAILIGFAPIILRAFFPDPHLQELGVEYLRIFALGLPCIGLWIMGEDIFSGAGDNVPPMVVSVIASWGVQIPAILIFTKLLGMDQTGVWWAKVLFAVSGALPILLWLKRGKWTQKRV